jgi:type VI secretion system protein ImpM
VRGCPTGAAREEPAMLQRLLAASSITPPAIWGKLPAHADFVSSGLSTSHREAWREWLEAQGDGVVDGDGAEDARALPTAFVLASGALPFAPRRFVVGVVAASSDRFGRPYPLVIYHEAHPRWVACHLRRQDHEPNDWFFWLARAVTRHGSLRDAADIRTLERMVNALWRQHAPTWLEIATSGRHGVPTPTRGRMQALLDRMAGPVRQDDPGRRFRGVRHLPWTDWPQRLRYTPGECAFWQQDSRGRYVNASDRLDTLWGGLS